MNAQGGHRQASRLKWALYVPWALSSELGVPHREAYRLYRAVLNRRFWRLLVINLLVVFPVTMIWFGLMSIGTIFLTSYRFDPSGAPAGETTTGPAGATVAPLMLAYLLAFGVGFLVIAAVVFGVYDAVIGRELRRCARTPACFKCGYDLSAVVGDTCPECGTARVGEPPARTVSP